MGRTRRTGGHGSHWRWIMLAFACAACGKSVIRSISRLAICTFLLTMLAGFGGWVMAQTTGASAQSRQALILAKPVAMKLARKLESKDPDELVFAAVYSVALRSIRVAYGTSPLREPLKVELTAKDEEAVMRHPEIYLLLEIGADSSVKVLDWGVAEKIVCVPSELRNRVQLGPDFGGYEATSTGALCAPSQIHR